jgi:hypothetical protein
MAKVRTYTGRAIPVRVGVERMITLCAKHGWPMSKNLATALLKERSKDGQTLLFFTSYVKNTSLSRKDGFPSLVIWDDGNFDKEAEVAVRHSHVIKKQTTRAPVDKRAPAFNPDDYTEEV